ncbi:MAG: iron-containing alcohol dehydrogenase [Deltaproteobacteria bacterium]|nr:iron-containing alcohol dehydrogenase [Deltaproteobacteria bacterium]
MSYSPDLSFIYFAPTKVVYGVGSVSELPMEVSNLGKRVVLVTDRGICDAGLVDEVRDILGDSLAGIFADVPQDTGMEVCDRGAEYAGSVGADVLVSLGGGSVIDTAKGMSIIMTEGGSLSDFQGMQMLTRPQTPHIVIPTTAGTGSEVTSAAVVLNREQGQKIIIYEYHITPRVAILDRGQMQVAALLAGWAFSNALLGLVHAMAHSIGAVRGIPHGLANGLFLPHVMRFNLEEVPGLTADIAEALGVNIHGMAPLEAGKAGIAAIEALQDRIRLPRRLRDIGVQEEDLKKAAELAMSDGSVVYNPRMVLSSDEVLEVYRKAY